MILILITLIATATAMAPYRVTIKGRVFNKVYRPYLNCQIPTQIFYGGSSSGKSTFVAARTILDMCNTDRNFIVVRKVGKTLKRSFFTECKKAIAKFKLKDRFRVNNSDLEITGPNGTKIYFCGLDDVEKVKSITAEKGVITDIIIEEATETAENDYEQLELRMRGKSKYVKRMTLLFNPIYRTHWICKRFFHGQNIKYREDSEILILHTTYKDNKFLAPDDIARIEKKKEVSPYHYMVYALGEWGILGDLIFTKWRTEDFTKFQVNADDSRGGLDFGFTNDPTAIIKTAINRAKKEIYIFSELYERGLTNPDIARMGKPIVGSLPTFCDSAEPKSIKELRENGMNAYPADKGKDSLLHSIQWLQGFTLIVDVGCINTQNELSMYQWQKDKDGNSINQPVGINDHIIAALRYAYSKDRAQGDYVSWI